MERICYSAEGWRLQQDIAKAPGEERRVLANFPLKRALTRELEDMLSLRQDTLISFVMADIRSHRVVTYGPDVPYTSQSCIKAPYIVSELVRDPGLLEREKPVIRELITVSDNDAYAYLREKYGAAMFSDWCNQLEIDFLPRDNIYARNATTRDFARLWVFMAEFLEQHQKTGDPLQEFVSYFGDTALSAIHDELGDRYPVRTKAGWEEGFCEGYEDRPAPQYVDGDPMNDEIAMNDTGVVYAESPYLLALFTGYQADPKELRPIVGALDRLHRAFMQE